MVEPRVAAEEFSGSSPFRIDHLLPIEILAEGDALRHAPHSMARIAR